MLKRLFLKFIVNDIIKKMPKFKTQAKEVVENNIDGFFDRVEQNIEALLLNIIAKKENK
jgi:vacuolar-type H+-ATPase subunit E/Vma4